MSRIKTATGLIALYMRLCGFKGWASFWRTVYVMPGYENADWLIRHEACHLAQIERLGRLRFSVHYLYWLARVGYDRHPMELEARAAEQRTSSPHQAGFFTPEGEPSPA